jgi:hypothetical protein
METFFLLKSFLDYNIFELKYFKKCLPNLISFTYSEVTYVLWKYSQNPACQFDDR